MSKFLIGIARRSLGGNSPQEAKIGRASKSELYQYMGTKTKQHWQPLDALAGLLVRPKCIYGCGSAPTPQYSPDSITGGEGARKNHSPTLGL